MKENLYYSVPTCRIVECAPKRRLLDVSPAGFGSAGAAGDYDPYYDVDGGDF